MKEYVRTGTLYSVRRTWEACCYMLKVAGNFSHDRRYEKTRWMCQACSLQVREDQDHLASCPGHDNLRSDLDITYKDDLVTFYKRVMERRKRAGWA